MPISGIWKRLATAVVFIPVFVWVVEGPSGLFHALIVALSAGACWELVRMLERAERVTHSRLAVAAAAIVTASFLYVPRGPTVALVVTLLVVLSASLFTPTERSVESAATTVLAVTYVSWLLGHAVLLRELPGGARLILFLVGVTWCGEAAAYAVGSTLGRWKLAPIISPGKTIEGAVAQLAVSVGAAPLLGLWLLPDWSSARLLGAGLLLGVLGQLGDLAESAIKRSLGTKDTGGLIPGHGGVLDRLDGLLFNAPALFYYVTNVGGGS